MKKVFLSYAKENFKEAKRLFNFLNAHPTIDVWMDKISLGAGADWKEEIMNQIEASDYVILLLSSHSTEKRGFFQKEMSFALECATEIPSDKIYLLPVRLDNCEIKKRYLKNKQYVDLFPDWNEGATRIIDAMKSHLREVQPGQSGGMRFTSHQAKFLRSSQYMFYFLNISNGNPVPVEITHVYYQDAENHILVNPPSRPLPQRLEVNEAWCTWIALNDLPNTFRSVAFERFQLRLSDGSIHNSVKENTIPPHGSVPGGRYTDQDTLPIYAEV